jgi:hypothetical protein
MSTFRNAIQALHNATAGKTVRTKNGSDLRTSVTIRLNKKDVNADATDSEHGRKAAEVDSADPDRHPDRRRSGHKNVMVYSVTIKHNRSDGSVYVHRLKEGETTIDDFACYRQTGRFHADD